MIMGTAAKAVEVEIRYAIYEERKAAFSGVTAPEIQEAWNAWSKAVSDLREAIYAWTTLLYQKEENPLYVG